MSATYELRALLDERGVEWWPMHDVENGYREDRDTEFLVYGCKHVAHEWGCRLQVDMLTPEQAIDATLGRGTCHAVFEVDAMSEDERVGEYVCSECGETFNDGHGEFPRYCPNCGREVVNDQ